MALTQTDLDNLDAAIATGELRVEFNGRMVIYRSIAQLKDARAHVLAVLEGKVASAPANPGSRSTNTYRYNFSTMRGD